jgi:glycosyltransferase involved in cell wall biosynthesis
LESIILKPIVSVVIPTFRRANLVKRSVISALSQTLTEIEVIVVIDGIDESTSSTLSQIDDCRLRVIELATNQGACFARDVGVKASQTEWIAFLDDDDEWMAQKLELQYEIAKASNYKFPIISNYLIARRTKGDVIYPRRLPHKSEPISEYLFVRNTLFQGEGLIQSSTIFAKKELLQQVPFENPSKKHEDWDWMLRSLAIEGAGVEFVPQTLSIWHLEETHQSLSRSFSWESSLHWIQSRRDLVTPRAYSSFLLSEVSARTARDRNFKGLFILVSEAFRYGKPSLMDLLLCLGMWLFPSDIRGKLRSLFYQQRQIFSFSSESSGDLNLK